MQDTVVLETVVKLVQEALPDRILILSASARSKELRFFTSTKEAMLRVHEQLTTYSVADTRTGRLVAAGQGSLNDSFEAVSDAIASDRRGEERRAA